MDREIPETLRRYQWMIEAFDESVLFIDRNGYVRTFNSGFLRFLQMDSEAIQDQHIKVLVGEEHYHRILRPRLKRCFSGEQLHVQNWIFLPRLGSRFVDAHYYPYRAEDGTVSGIVANLRDITQAKQHQAKIVELQTDEAVVTGDLDLAVRKVAEVVAETLDIARLGIWLFENDFAELRCVHVFQRASGEHSAGPLLSVDQHPGYFQSLSDAWMLEVDDARQDPRTRELLATYLEHHDVVSMLIAPIRIGGEIIGVVTHEHTGRPRAWQAEEATVAGEVANLIAQTMMGHNHHELEERLRQAHKMESLGVLAGGIAHDFNNLLVGMLGGVDLSLSLLDPGHPARKTLEMISDSATHASELCNQLLAYAGRAKYVRQARELSGLVARAVRMFESSIPASIRLELNLGKKLPATEVDIGQVRQMVMNLLANAVEAIGPSSGRITLKTGLCEKLPAESDLLPRVPEAKSFLFLEVTDDGRGMDTDTQSRMFDPFFTTKNTGRGLGLAAVLGIVRGHGGALTIRSAPGHGTSIRVLLPTTDRRPEPDTVELDRQKLAARNEALILVVDDEEMVRRIARCILEKHGFRVLTAENGLEGLNVFRDHSDEIDAVLLDIKMPIMDGEETFREMQRIKKEVNVVLSSGFSEDYASQRFEGLRHAGFLKKPYRAESLLNKIRRSIKQTIL